MTRYLLGIDSGLTVTKAVLFDAEGREAGRASVRIPQRTPRPRWVERDVEELWQGAATAVRGALEGVRPQHVAAVAVTGHGDGLYLVDADGGAVRPGILSLDSRAHEIVERWQAEGVPARALELTGQEPWVSAPAALLAWASEHEPRALERAAWALACKDVIKLRLTGEASADPTEASTSFCDVSTQVYSDDALALYGVGHAQRLLAPVVGSSEPAGALTAQAAELTGLRAGTPVVSGLHDVDASAIGSGTIAPGQLSLVAGTFSINQTLADEPVRDPSWLARSFVTPGRWMHMALSPASATNLDWFVQRLCADSYAGDGDVFELVERDAAAVADDPSGVLFLPFLYGSPLGATPSAAFLGVRGWHGRGHLLRAVLEGVVFNHRWHVGALRSRFELQEARLTGGASRSALWSQMFADALALPILVPEAEETGALGAAICAGIGAGVYGSLEQAVAAAVRTPRSYEPRPNVASRLDERFTTYATAVEALAPVWGRLG